VVTSLSVEGDDGDTSGRGRVHDRATGARPGLSLDGRHSARWAGAALTALAAALAGGFLAAAASARPSGASFTLSGEVHGTLTETAPCGKATLDSLTADFQIFSAIGDVLRSPGSSADMTGKPLFEITFFSRTGAGGTFSGPFSQKSATEGGPAVLVQVPQAYAWIATSGTFTNHGRTGSVSVRLVPDHYSPVDHPGPGDLHLSGSWNCAAH